MMANERWLRIKQLFDSSVDLTPQDRDAFLADACLDDAALRQEVESLVESSLRSGTFLEDPAKTRRRRTAWRSRGPPYRAVRGRPTDRRGRNGRCLSRTRHATESDCRDQSAGRPARRSLRPERAIRTRGESHLCPQPSADLPPPRCRPTRHPSTFWSWNTSRESQSTCTATVGG